VRPVRHQSDGVLTTRALPTWTASPPISRALRRTPRFTAGDADLLESWESRCLDRAARDGLPTAPDLALARENSQETTDSGRRSMRAAVAS